MKTHQYLFLKILMKLKFLKKVRIIPFIMNFNINVIPSRVTLRKKKGSFDGLGMFQGVSFLIKEALSRQLYWNQEESKHPFVVLETRGKKIRIQCPVVARGSLYHLIEEGKESRVIVGYKKAVEACF